MSLRVGEDCNKGINNLDSVVSGETLYNWCSEVIKYPNIVYYATSRKVAGRFPMSLDFPVYLIFPAALRPWRRLSL
jgi:hypothetical protein